jgi:superfamily II DNA or RNA helicase
VTATSHLVDCEVAFVPADPPRAGRVAVYRPGGGALPPAPGRAGTVAVVTGPDGAACDVPAVLVRPERACKYLLAQGDGTDSSRVWALAARKALDLIARGRFVPGLDAAGSAAWRIAGLEGPEGEWLHRLADAMPVPAYAATRDGRLPDPHRLLRAFLDAVADSLTRGPAATERAGEHAFTVERPVAAPKFDWAAQQLAHGRDDGYGLAFVVDPDGYYTRMRPVKYDRADPARLVSFASIGESEYDLRHQLAFIGRELSWPTLADRGDFRHGHSLDLYLDPADLAYLFNGGGIEGLREHGIEVRCAAPIQRGVSASLSLEGPELAGTGGLDALDQRLDFRWHAIVGDRELTEAELEKIADSHGLLVDLGDRWVLLDEHVRRRLHSRLGKPAPLEALRAALTGSVCVAGQAVPVAVTGPLAVLRDRLQGEGRAARVRQPAALAGHLRDYQLRGLSWLTGLAELGLGACLADDMGLGKTITLIAHHLARQADGATAGPTLVVCPASLMANWAAEIRRFAPGTAVRRFHGPGRDLDGIGEHEFVLTTYGTLRRDAPALAAVEWGMVCADEAQHAKNPGSATAKALRSIDTGSRVALTGTPVENRPTDLWSILDWTTPGLLGSLKGFREAYGRDAERGDAETAARLGALVRPFMLRRLKTDPGIAPELPAKTLTDQHVILSNEQAALYRRVVDESMSGARAADGIERRGRVLALLNRLKQVCNHPAQYHGSLDPAAGKSGKLELLDELLDTIAAEGEHAIVFTQYTQMGKLLAIHLDRCGVTADFLHGQTPVRQRERIVADFQNGRTPVLLLSLKAAGVGLNLTRATHVVHYDRWWNPAAEDQATDRAFRIGQTRAVQVHRLICEGTLEERIAALLARKRALAEAVVGSGEAALTELTDEQLLELVHLEER